MNIADIIIGVAFLGATAMLLGAMRGFYDAIVERKKIMAREQEGKDGN